MLKSGNRLRKTADFLRVYKQGKHVVARQAVVYFLSVNHGGVRVGVVASKKVGSSVERGRCKRLLRESIRSVLPRIARGHDIVIVARPSLREEKFAEVNKVMARLLHKAGLFGARQ